MGVLKGQNEYKRFKAGDDLTRKEAILATCFHCNGEEDGREDCGGHNCPLYQYFSYRGLRPNKHAVGEL